MRFIFYLALTISILLSTSCNNDNPQYKISVRLIDDSSAAADSATLYSYEPDYDKISLLETKAITTKNYADFHGDFSSSKIGFLKLKSDTILYYLVLDSIETRIVIGNNQMIVENGSRENRAIISTYKFIENLDKSRNETFKTYLAACSDSTLTEEMENKFVLNNKLLLDSTQSHLKKLLEIESPLSYIIWHRYSNICDSTIVPNKYR